jgi:hypothetical protein
MTWLPFVNRVRKTTTRKPVRRFRSQLEIESLEERQLLSATFLKPIVPELHTLTPQIISTVPKNGDVNPYGIAIVPQGFKSSTLLPGDTLIANFNNSQNMQGTGTTITRIGPGGQTSTFFQGPAGLGLDAGLAALKAGFVLVGNMPTTDGTSNTVQPGSLILLDGNGNIVTTLTSNPLIDGPWDFTVNDQGRSVQVFVSNVLNGTVTRIDMTFDNGVPVVHDEVTIASGYPHRGDPAALEIGPAGLAFDAHTNTLYVASSLDNEIFAVAHAGTTFADHGKGKLVYKDDVHLHGPLGLAFAPNGDLITANADAVNVDPNQPSELVEFTRTGHFVGQFSVDPSNGGAFNVNVYNNGGQVKVSAVDDNANTLKVWSLYGLVTKLPGLAAKTISTVPSNGDVNPYGIAVVPQHFQGKGVLQPGDTLVSNYNNKANMQGTGTTITLITPGGQTSTFFQGTSGLGLGAGLAILRNGLVIVGNFPTTDGTSNTAMPGSILILDSNGQVVKMLTSSKFINGPWDLTVNDQGNRFQIFIANVLSGTVSRIDLALQNGKPVVVDKVQIGSGYPHRGDPAALEIGPAGLAYDAATDTLYIASSLENAVFAIGHAGARFTDSGKGALVDFDPVHFHGPLGLVLAPNGDLITANNDSTKVDPNQPSELVEFTRSGKYVGEFSIDPANAGSFNVAVTSSNGHVTIDAVDDNTNSLDIWTL